MVYINTKTLEYPRHAEDISSAPEDFAPVIQTPMPLFQRLSQLCYELPPEFINGAWTVVWCVRDMTKEEIDQISTFNAGVQ